MTPFLFAEGGADQSIMMVSVSPLWLDTQIEGPSIEHNHYPKCSIF